MNLVCSTDWDKILSIVSIVGVLITIAGSVFSGVSWLMSSKARKKTEAMVLSIQQNNKIITDYQCEEIKEKHESKVSKEDNKNKIIKYLETLPVSYNKSQNIRFKQSSLFDILKHVFNDNKNMLPELDDILNELALITKIKKYYNGTRGVNDYNCSIFLEIK